MVHQYLFAVFGKHSVCFLHSVCKGIFFFSLPFRIGVYVFGHIKFEQIWYFSLVVEM
jgi:hypothetical protein